MQDGGCHRGGDGCHPEDGCQDGTASAGADFRFLAANVVHEGTGRPLFRPYAIQQFRQGIKVGFIGLTLEGTPDHRVGGGHRGARVPRRGRDRSTRCVAHAAQARAACEAIVVLLHEGGAQQPPTPVDINGCNGLTAPIVDIVEQHDRDAGRPVHHAATRTSRTSARSTGAR